MKKNGTASSETTLDRQTKVVIESGERVGTGIRGLDEILGGGLTHRDVLQSAGLDPNNWQAFAFGVGIDRLVMLKYGIDDIRQLYSGDLRLVSQF